ncbi:hypothetical protein AC1031_004544 [Aphanomyces cochlioides]|nr:hypothetical protein AC1031_004544 [Aphanomyces cochlioides]
MWRRIKLSGESWVSSGYEGVGDWSERWLWHGGCAVGHGDGSDANYFDFVYDTAKPSSVGEDYMVAAKAVLKDPTKHDVTLNGTPSMWLHIKTSPLENVLLHLTRSERRPVDDAYAKLKVVFYGLQPTS